MKSDSGPVTELTVRDPRRETALEPINSTPHPSDATAGKDNLPVPVAPPKTRVSYVRPDDPPSMGIQKYLWRLGVGQLYARTGSQQLLGLTPVSVNEAILRQEASLALKRAKKPMIIGFANRKGGVGKTQGAVNETLGEAKATGQDILLVDLNPFGNHAAPRMGITQRSPNVVDLLDDRTILKDKPTFDSHCGYHPIKGYHMVRAVTFDGGKNVGSKLQPDLEKVISLILAFASVTHTLILDCGQDPTSSWGEAAIKTCDVMVVNMLVGQRDSYEDALRTLAAYKAMDPAYLNKCVLVIHRHAGKIQTDTADWYHKELERIVSDNPEEDFVNLPSERTFVVPYDRELDDKLITKQPKSGGGSKPKHATTSRPLVLENYNPRTYLAILECANRLPEIAEAATHMAAEEEGSDAEAEAPTQEPDLQPKRLMAPTELNTALAVLSDAASTPERN